MAQIVTLVRKTKEIFSRVKNGAYCDTRRKKNPIYYDSQKDITSNGCPRGNKYNKKNKLKTMNLPKENQYTKTKTFCVKKKT